MDREKGEQLASWLEEELGVEIVERSRANAAASEDFEKFARQTGAASNAPRSPATLAHPISRTEPVGYPPLVWRFAPLTGPLALRQPGAMNLNRITRRLSYSNVIASLALFVALGGASYAAVALPANSVGTKQLKKSAVSAAKLKRNAVSSAKVKDGSLERGDFASGTLLQGPQGPQGDKGDSGPVGPQGLQGERGLPGVSGYEIVSSTSAFTSDSGQETFAECPAGKVALGGGAAIFGGVTSIALHWSQPLGDGSGWDAAAHEVVSTPDSWRVAAYAVCAKLG